MENSNPQLTPELRHALLTHPDQPVYIADDETRKIYVLVEKGKYPELEESYIRDALELARAQIAGGEISKASIQDVIAEAERRHFSQT
jgi:Arc/MetJ-type ribon-helix-helix transcriptional regulator